MPLIQNKYNNREQKIYFVLPVYVIQLYIVTVLQLLQILSAKIVQL